LEFISFILGSLLSLLRAGKPHFLIVYLVLQVTSYICLIYMIALFIPRVVIMKRSCLNLES